MQHALVQKDSNNLLIVRVAQSFMQPAISVEPPGFITTESREVGSFIFISKQGKLFVAYT